MTRRRGGARRTARLPRPRIALLAAISVAAACGDAVQDEALDGRAFGRDLALVEEVRIDGHEELLVPVRDVAVGEHGRIAVIQSQTHTVRIFDPSGRPVGSVGGEGDGPGEFRGISAVGWHGEVLWALDPSSRRLTFFAADLSLDRSTSLPDSITIDGRSAALHAIQPNPDGSRLAYALVPDSETERRSRRFLRLGPEAEVVPVARRPFLEDWFSFETWAIPIPFARATHLDTSPDGDLLVFVRATRPDAPVGRLEVMGIDPSSPTADTLWIREIDVEQQPLPGGVADSAVDANVETYAAFPVPGLEQAYRRDVNVPETFPPLTGVVVGRTGRVWLELRVRDGIRPYWILDQRGTPFGRVEAPANVRIVQADGTRAWAIETDEVGVEHVVGYRIAPRAR